MSERVLFRFGGAAAILGALGGAIANVLHPRVSDFGEGYPENILTEIAASGSWLTVHVVILFAVFLGTIGLIAVARSITGASGMERLAFAAAIGGGTIGSVSVAIDGYAVKSVADTWAAASSADQAAVFFTASAMSDIGWANFMLIVMTLFGAIPAIFGWAILLGGGYPKWLGWVGVVIGLASIVLGVTGIFGGPSTSFFSVYLPLSLLFTLWALILGVLLWGKAGEAPAGA